MTALDTKAPLEGVTREKLTALVAEVDAADAACPCRGGKYRYDECPKCGATSRQPCGPVSSAEYRVVEAVRAALKGEG